MASKQTDTTPTAEERSFGAKATYWRSAPFQALHGAKIDQAKAQFRERRAGDQTVGAIDGQGPPTGHRRRNERPTDPRA